LFLPFALDLVPALTWLRHHAGITAIARSLLGERWTYATSDTNVFNCDTNWHHDGFVAGARHVHVMVYLDPLETGSGALQVVPGSHLDGSFRDILRGRLTARASRGNCNPLGTDQDELPAQEVAIAPGDVVVIDPRTFHASFGGTLGRRLIMITFGPPPTREATQQFIAAYTTEASPQRHHLEGHARQRPSWFSRATF
jgi:ectoine hydroxylase-related dioxygenase (phytanoyl-CoA dioxygenase family)